MDTYIILILLIIMNMFTVYRWFFNMIFRDKDDFNESVKFLFIPDIISLFRGEYMRDRIAELKFGFFMILCIITTVIEYNIVDYVIRMII